MPILYERAPFLPFDPQYYHSPSVKILDHRLKQSKPVKQSSMSPLSIETTVTLNNDTTIPQLGLGVFNSSTCRDACLKAFDDGYRHIDTAQLYDNEEEVGVSSYLSEFRSCANQLVI